MRIDGTQNGIVFCANLCWQKGKELADSNSEYGFYLHISIWIR